MIQRLSAFPGMMFFGTVIALMQKYVFDQKSFLSDPLFQSSFHKPWFQTFVTYFGMCLALLTHEGTRLIKKVPIDTEAVNSKYQPGSNEERHNRWIFYVSAIMPALCGVLVHAFQNIALIYIPVSVWMAFKSSLNVFYPAFNRIFFKKEQPNLVWISVLLVVFALIMIGYSTIQTSSLSSSYVYLGLFLVLISQVIQSMLLLLETYLFDTIQSTPSLIISMEGFWGLLIVFGIFFPALQGQVGHQGIGLSEDLFDTIVLLKNNLDLLSLEISLLFLYCFSSLSTLTATGPSPELRPIVDVIQAIGVWVCQLMIRASIKRSNHYSLSIGEEWTSYSFLQLFGEFLLLCAAFTYMHVLKPNIIMEDQSEVEVIA